MVNPHNDALAFLHEGYAELAHAELRAVTSFSRRVRKLIEDAVERLSQVPPQS
ncbi:MAG: hypothetical protein M3Y41_13170 [Pseudomonadota bacterium]|nr:hypothetical protein [Pseudomonadota bacterium]